MFRLRQRLSIHPFAACAIAALALLPGIAAALPASTQANNGLDIKVCFPQDGGQACFAALSMGFQVTNPAPASSGGGAGAGKPVFSEVSVTKPIDALTPNLFLWAAIGRVLPSVTVTITPKSDGVTTVGLTDVSIVESGPKISTDSGTPEEGLKLVYKTITLQSGGKSTCFNVETYSQCGP